MAQRNRKRGRRSKAAPTARSAPSKAGARRGRAEERDAAVRAALIPLAPGERPWAITIGAALAAISGVTQLILYLAGIRLRSSGVHASAGQTIAFTALMLICATGMWLMLYWAVLGFMALLAILIVFAFAALVKVSSLLGVVVALAIIGVGGLLFFKLIRVLSRIQMPKYPGR